MPSHKETKVTQMRFLSVLMLTATPAFTADDADPIGVWSFDGRSPTFVQDRGPYRAHGVVRGEGRRGPGPWGQAMWFDGEVTYVIVPDRTHLRMTNAVTVDVWVKLPEPATGEPQCVIDKRGERYRIQINSNGSAMFGLKAGGKRADLSGGKLKPDTWHRITGVFQRPKMELYVDCEKVGERTWDHDVGPGRNLIFGSKSGVIYFMKGWLAHVCIYNVARPPQPDDADRFSKETTAMPEDKLEVLDGQQGLFVDTGAAQFMFASKSHGGLWSVKVGEKRLVRARAAPPLFGVLMESKVYDGCRDYVEDAKLLDAAYQLRSFEHKQEGDALSIVVNAELSWPGGDRVLAEMRSSLEAGSAHIATAVALKPDGRFTNRFVRELGLQLPLALNFRKRVVQGGDQGWQFDTRHYYQYHLDTRRNLMTEPEHNWWRYFMVEQDRPTHFRAWRSESADTAALTAQHGHQAPGWMAAYDQQGGILWAYRRMHERPAKAVAADAEDSGLARVYLHPPTAPAIAVSSPQAKKSLFEGAHRTDWVCFDGEIIFAQPARTLAEAWGEEQLASDPPARPKIVELDLWDAPPATDDRVPLVVGGLPLPKAAISNANQMRLLKGDKDVPCQARPVAYWPDRSIKWLLLIFPLEGRTSKSGRGEGQTLDFNVTLRQGGSERFRLLYGHQIRRGVVSSALSARQESDRVHIDTGPLSLVVAKGQTWLRDIRLRGRPILSSPDDHRTAFVDFLRNDNAYVVNTTHPQGTLDPGALEVDKVELEESGLLRAVVRMEGMTTSEEPQRVILRLEAYAGRSWVRLFHSVEFLHKDPRRAFVRSMGLSLPLKLDPKKSRFVAGTQTGPKALGEAAATGLRQTSHLSCSLWQQPSGQRFADEVEQGQRCRGWLTWTDDRVGCTAVVRNMWQEYPKEIVADPQAGELRIGLWPESHPLMDVRRYSNYPHPSQGESARHPSSWVDKSYYPNDPFVGVSKTHELLLYFHDANVPAEQIDAVAADFQSPGLVYVTPEWYASLGIALPYPAPDEERFLRMDANLENVTSFWLFHQKIWAWYGMWDFGDVMHKFGPGGYGWILPPDEIARLLKLPAEERHSIDVSSKRMYDYRAQQDWCFDNGRWGWGNTEGLPGLFLQMQYLRTGRRDIYFAVEAMARHTRDVDMRHDGMWFGKGTRHGVQHWSDGNHEERQTVHSEWRFYHYLSGDLRCRDFAEQLTERHYTSTPISIHAAHSGRLYGLLTRWEMTGDPQLAEMLKKYVHCFITPEGIDIAPSVQFPAVTQVGGPREVNGQSMFFHTFGAMHALLEYYELTRDSKLRDALVRMADSYVAQERRSYTFRKVVNFAAMHADDPTPYRRVLDEWLRSSQDYCLFHMVSDTPKHWTGQTAFLRPGVSGQWFWLADAHYLMAALEREPEPTPERLAAFQKLNERGSPHGYSRRSWQAEYDRPDLAEYLRDRRRERTEQE